MDSIDATVGAAIGLQQANLQMQTNVAILRKAMDSQEMQAQALLAALPEPAPISPQIGPGRRVDIYA